MSVMGTKVCCTFLAVIYSEFSSLGISNYVTGLREYIIASIVPITTDVGLELKKKLKFS